jgi:hypothetical protein
VSLDQSNATAWLADADHDPAHALDWWAHDLDHVALIPIGRSFDLIQVPLTRGILALASLRDTAPRSWPVYTDREGDTVSFLVPVGTSATWVLDGTTALGDATYAWMPPPSALEPVGISWLQPPDGSGSLWDPQVLREALRTVS